MVLNFIKNSRKQHSVYLCYATDDLKSVERVYRKLKKVGVSVWFDQAESVYRESFAESIGHAISCCDFFIIFVSDSATRSQWMQFEIELILERRFATGKEIVMLPVILDDTSISSLFENSPKIDFRQNFEEEMEKLLYRLKETPLQIMAN